MSAAPARPQTAEMCFEDLPVGFAFAAGPTPVTRDAILAFAGSFDPQPFHLDEAAAAETPLGGLAASGWHTAAIGMRLLYDGLLWQTASLGAPGVEALRWRHPVRPDDSLRLSGRVTAARVSASRPDRGLVTVAFELANQDGVLVMTQENSVFVARRPAARVG